MLKILAILALCYFFFRSVGHVVRALFGGGSTTRTQPTSSYGHQQKRRSSEGLHVDSVPNPNQGKKKEDFKGGDYVDYEEVKE
jgi:hypothetical protein